MRLSGFKLVAAFIFVAVFYAACTPEKNKIDETEQGGKDIIIHVTGISLNKTSATIIENESIVLEATVTPDNANNKRVLWSSNNNKVATVDESGVVIAIATGSATITAKSEDTGKTATCSVTVIGNTALSVTVGTDKLSAISVVLKGKANLPASVAADLKIGFQYSKSAGILPTNSTTVDADDADADYNYTTRISWLDPETTYYYRSFVRQNGQDTYGEIKSFTTPSLLETLDADNISETKARMNAKLDLTNIQYKSLKYGFFWGTSESSQHTYEECSNLSESVFLYQLSGLTRNKQYWFKTRVVVDSRVYWGEVKSFTTNDIDAIVETLTATDISETKATLNGKLTVNSTESWEKSVWFLYSNEETTLDGLKSSGTKILSTLGGDGSFKSSLIDLTFGTIYYYVSVAKVGDKEFYGGVITFTTKDISVETLDATEISQTKATLNGKLATSATESLSKSVWFLYSHMESTRNDFMYNYGTKVSSTLSNDGSFKSSANLKDNQTYYYIAVAKVDNKNLYGEVKKFTTKAYPYDVPERVSLGLSVEWSKWNLGATSPEGYGDYFAWGEIEPKTDYSWSTYKWCNGSEYTFTKYNNDGSRGTVDNNKEFKDCNYEDDAARAGIGYGWRTPTDAEWTELINKCTWTWTDDYNGTGVAGYIITGNKAGYTDKSIFLPAAGMRYNTTLQNVGSYGYYWSASVYTYYGTTTASAWRLVFYPNFASRVGSGERCAGFTIRPVK